MRTKTCIALILWLTACSPVIRVYTDYEPDYDLWQYGTYNWIQIPNIESGNNPFYYNEFNDKKIKSAVKEQLTSRGYQLTEDKPDLTFHYHIIVENKLTVVSRSCDNPYPPFWVSMHTSAYPYKEGTLILDLTDTKTNQLVWRGWAISALDVLNTPDQIDHLIKTAVRKMLVKFPAAKHPHPAVKDLVSNE